MHSTDQAIGAPGGQRRRFFSWLVDRWPTAAGVVFAAFVVLQPQDANHILNHSELAPVVTASGFVYLTTAALRRRAAAWPMFFVTVVVIGIVSYPHWDRSWASWAMLGIAAVLVAYGLSRGALRPLWGVPLQAAAMIVLTAAAVTAGSVDARWAGMLVGAGLFAHAAWDVYHHRTGRVVVRSMAEFCGVLDTLLALVILGVTLSG